MEAEFLGGGAAAETGVSGSTWNALAGVLSQLPKRDKGLVGGLLAMNGWPDAPEKLAEASSVRPPDVGESSDHRFTLQMQRNKEALYTAEDARLRRAVADDATLARSLSEEGEPDALGAGVGSACAGAGSGQGSPGPRKYRTIAEVEVDFSGGYPVGDGDEDEQLVAAPRMSRVAVDMTRAAFADPNRYDPLCVGENDAEPIADVVFDQVPPVDRGRSSAGSRAASGSRYSSASTGSGGRSSRSAAPRRRRRPSLRGSSSPPSAPHVKRASRLRPRAPPADTELAKSLRVVQERRKDIKDRANKFRSAVKVAQAALDEAVRARRANRDAFEREDTVLLAKEEAIAILLQPRGPWAPGGRGAGSSPGRRGAA